MAGRVTEEQLTKAILNWLGEHSWEVVSFDFPQSGTGSILHPDNRAEQTKNKNSIIPDIVAIRGENVVLFENKDRFVLADIEKVKNIKTSHIYDNAIKKLLNNYDYKNVYYGVGLPDDTTSTHKIKGHEDELDFVVQTDGNSVKVTYQSTNIFHSCTDL